MPYTSKYFYTVLSHGIYILFSFFRFIILGLYVVPRPVTALHITDFSNLVDILRLLSVQTALLHIDWLKCILYLFFCRSGLLWFAQDGENAIEYCIDMNYVVYISFPFSGDFFTAQYFDRVLTSWQSDV